MVQSGIRTANHRAFGSNWKKIEENDLVILDVGCVYDGYGSDLTRTWVVGKSTEAQKRIARHLAEVHDKILALMKPGVTLGEIFDFRRKEVRNSGCITDMAAMPAMPANGSGLGGVTIHRIGLGPCMIHPT